MWFSAEEHGLYGSRHYVQAPTRPLAKTSLMINLDMVGRNPQQPAEVLGVFSARGSTLKQLVEKAGAEGGLAMDIKTEPPEDDSDHASFLERGVPAVFFFTGYHEDYHRNSDQVEKLSGERLQEVARTAFSLAVAAADLPERLRFDPDIRPKRLGIEVGVPMADEELKAFPEYASAGAILVRLVSRESVAAQAGLKPGDLIVELGGERLPREGAQEKLRAVLNSVKRGVPVPVRVVRDGQLVLLSATWPDVDQP
ncbi:MAG: M28 family peptidase [Planctomycetota bacterium]